jgi:hypothetical protein
VSSNEGCSDIDRTLDDRRAARGGVSGGDPGVVSDSEFTYNEDVVNVDSHLLTLGEPGRPDLRVRELAELRNEFGRVRICLDERGNSPRLQITDVETGASILVSPLELASLCLATDDDRLDWLRVGHYRDERPR